MQDLFKQFNEYHKKNKGERFWQALKNWSGASEIRFMWQDKDTGIIMGEDTYYWEDKKQEGIEIPTCNPNTLDKCEKVKSDPRECKNCGCRAETHPIPECHNFEPELECEKVEELNKKTNDGPYCGKVLNDKVKPEGVGEWRKILKSRYEANQLDGYDSDCGKCMIDCKKKFALEFAEEFEVLLLEEKAKYEKQVNFIVEQALRQEKAKWKGEVMKLMKNVVHIQDQPDFLAFKKDEVLTLIDKL